MFATYHRVTMPGRAFRLACCLALGVVVACATTLGEAVLIAVVR